MSFYTLWNIDASRNYKNHKTEYNGLKYHYILTLEKQKSCSILVQDNV